MVFDVNGTLSDMSPIAASFAELGAPALAAELWFASVLRDGFALTAAGASERFATLAEGSVEELLEALSLRGDPRAAAEHVLARFRQLDVHPDVEAGVRALRSAGLALVTLSNGSADIGEELLRRAGLRDEFERVLSVEEPGSWKPARAAYLYAAEVCDVEPSDMVLVAVHPWDLDGAARAGLRTAFLNRSGARYPAYFRPPDHTASTLAELAGQLPG